MAIAHTLGFPRIGAQRELKFALESFWRGDITEAVLHNTGHELRARHWAAQQAAGLDFVTVGDFAWYDQVLNTLALLGATPARFPVDGAAQFGRLLHDGTRQRAPLRDGNDQVVRYQLPLPGAGMDRRPALRRRRRLAVRRSGGSGGARPSRQGGAAGAAVAAVPGQDQVRPGAQARPAAARAGRLPKGIAAPARRRHRMGADRRADPGAGAGRGLARGVCAGLRRAGAGRAEDSAGHLFRRSARTRRAAARVAGGRRAPGPGARRRSARLLFAGLAGRPGAVGRRHRRPQHLARRSRRACWPCWSRSRRASAIGCGLRRAARCCTCRSIWRRKARSTTS